MPHYLDLSGLTRYDGKIKVLIATVNTAVANEASARQSADNALGTRITTLENAGFITKSVDDLVNYYKKSETYTKAEVLNLISGATMHFVILQTLPQDPSQYYGPYIVLVPQSRTGTSNIYDEYVVVEYGSPEEYHFEKIGSTEVDLSGYVPKTTKVNGKALSGDITIVAADISDVYSKTEINNLLNNKVDKVSGKGLSTNDYTTAEKNKLAGLDSRAQENKLEYLVINGVEKDPDSDKKISFSVPTKTSDLQNDSGFITGVDSITNAEIDALFS